MPNAGCASASKACSPRPGCGWKSYWWTTAAPTAASASARNMPAGTGASRSFTAQTAASARPGRGPSNPRRAASSPSWMRMTWCFRICLKPSTRVSPLRTTCLSPTPAYIVWTARAACAKCRATGIPATM